MTAGARLHKALADMGLGSRREIEGWIQAGRVSVNGRAAVLGQRLEPGDRVEIDGRPLRMQEPQPAAFRVIVYNKPEGEICSRRDPEGRPTVFAALPRLRDSRWIIVGRLDLNTSGLLLATDSGELANRLMHPGSELEREYLVRVMGDLDPGVIARLRGGVLLEDGMAAFDDIRERAGAGSNRWFSVVLREGRNREVRRLWESQGCKVSRLKRIRFGPVKLGPRDRRGTWRELGDTEMRELCGSVGMRPPLGPMERARPGVPAERTRSGPVAERARPGAAAERTRSGPAAERTRSGAPAERRRSGAPDERARSAATAERSRPAERKRGSGSASGRKDGRKPGTDATTARADGKGPARRR